MATGDSTDIFARLKGVLPARWFGSATDSTPFVDAALTAAATCLSFCYSLYAYAKLQTRILTATDGWLDLIASDFFGAVGLLRAAGESDASYRGRIIANLLREKATRKAIIQTLTTLTGRAPTIIEPARPADVGAYGVPTSGYGAAGFYGSLSLPYQAFVIAYRPHSNSGIASVAGYGVPTGAYSTASQSEYASLSMWNAGVSDAAIFAAIDAVKMGASIVWTRISN